MGRRRALAAVVVAMSLTFAGCAHVAAEGKRFGPEAWARAVGRAQLGDAGVVYPFETTPEMRAWSAAVVAPFTGADHVELLDAIQNAMFDDAFGFSYLEDTTLTAAEAFRVRRGNCMSFTALFIALTRAANIPTFLLSVRRTPEIEREEDLVVVNRHVVAGFRTATEVKVFDFYLATKAPFIQQRVIDDVLATAMYHNNMGGAAIRAGDLAGAVRQLEIATTLEPRWAPAWVNLGVARSRTRDLEGALDAHARALELEPGNTSALTNMAYVYRQLGRTEEAQNALRAAALRTTNPFTLISMADAEMVRGNLDEAARFLKKARWWSRTQPEVHDAWARLARRRGDEKLAARHEQRAAELRAREPAGDG